jgi:DNA-binding beta-propeller fold protein YncE
LEPPPVWLFEWGSTGSDEGQFQFNVGGAIDTLGNVYAVDTYQSRVQKFDKDGNFLLMWGWGVDTGASAPETCTSGCLAGIAGSGDGQFDGPRGIAVEGYGKVYVADELNRRLQIFKSDGTFVAAWGWGVETGDSKFEICTSGCQAGISGSGDGQFGEPAGVDLDVGRNVYVVDGGNRRIQVFDRNGNFLRKWGSNGTGDGEFQSPQGIAVSESGHVYVSDLGANRVQKFGLSGNYLAKWGTACDTSVSGEENCDGGFNQPIGIDLDSAENVYVADTANNRLQKFDSYGNFLSRWGSPSGPVSFWWPYDVAVSPLASGHIYIIEAGNPLIRVFGGPWMEFWVGEPVPQPE